jgi:hypothetical protein
MCHERTRPIWYLEVGLDSFFFGKPPPPAPVIRPTDCAAAAARKIWLPFSISACVARICQRWWAPSLVEARPRLSPSSQCCCARDREHLIQGATTIFYLKCYCHQCLCYFSAVWNRDIKQSVKAKFISGQHIIKILTSPREGLGCKDQRKKNFPFFATCFHQFAHNFLFHFRIFISDYNVN